MSFIQSKDFALEVARGNIAGIAAVNKFGRSTDVDTVLTDIIDDVANVIWDAPTTARIHDIISSSASDDGAPPGVGARTIRAFGLTDWAVAEVSEDIVMNGVANVPTVNSYVIIHRIEVLTKGATSANVGTITATAQVDGTITAQINPSQGQTQMAVYGLPSIQKAYMSLYFTSLNRVGGPGANVDMSLLVNTEPDAELTNFLTKHTAAGISDGTSHFNHGFNPYFEIPGPAIIKMQGISSVTNTDVSAGFDLYLVDN